MKRLRDVSIRQKLAGTVLLVTLSVLLLACLALAVQEIATYRRTMEQDMTVLADLLGRGNAVALDLDQEENATEKLAGLAADRHIVSARLYRKDGSKFADYLRVPAPLRASCRNKPLRRKPFSTTTTYVFPAPSSSTTSPSALSSSGPIWKACMTGSGRTRSSSA